MFVVTVLFEVERSDASTFLQRALQQAEDSLREQGCQRFDVCVDQKRPERVFLYEIYDDAAAFAAHLSSEHFLAFDRGISAITREKSVTSWELKST